MGIVLTKYEDSANNNIVFDSSKFDYDIDDDSFPTDARTDFDNILLENGDVFYVVRETDTLDSMGVVESISSENLRIYAVIQDISKKDRVIHEMGLAVEGNRKMFVKHEYSITSGGVDSTHVVKEGDVLKDRNQKFWRVVKIVSEPFIVTNEIFKVCIVQSIELGGSG